MTLDEYGAHRDNAVGQAFRGGNDVGLDAEKVGGERGTEPAEGGDDFVEYQ